jgi:hypothetical protein
MGVSQEAIEGIAQHIVRDPETMIGESAGKLVGLLT